MNGCSAGSQKTSGPPLAWYNFDTRERISIFLAEMLPIKADTHYPYVRSVHTGRMYGYCVSAFTVPPQITCASAIPGKTEKHENCIFHSNAVLVHCQHSTGRSLISSIFWLTTHTLAAVWLAKSCNQCVHLGAVGRHSSRERKSRALQQFDYVARTMH